MYTRLGTDHLDRHGSLANYHAAKAQLAQAATERVVAQAAATVEVAGAGGEQHDPHGLLAFASGWRAFGRRRAERVDALVAGADDDHAVDDGGRGVDWPANVVGPQQLAVA